MRPLLLLLTLLLAAPALAAESAPATTARDTASLVSETDSIAPGHPFRLGLRLRMAPGWHTYWSNPGDAGAPPALDVTGAATGPIAYPSPEVLREGPFTSYAYTGEVLLPVTATAAAPASMTAHAQWLVCAKVCVPEEATFHLDLPAGSGAPGAQAALFAEADARMPRPSPFAAHITADGVLWLQAPGLVPAEALFLPDAPGVIDQAAPQTLQVAQGRVSLALKPLKAPLHALAGVLRLTDRSGQVTMLAVTATPGALPADTGPMPEAGPGLAEALVLAFAGGLVLNLMPCVLPILAMKALALARLSGAARTPCPARRGRLHAGACWWRSAPSAASPWRCARPAGRRAGACSSSPRCSPRPPGGCCSRWG